MNIVQNFDFVSSYYLSQWQHQLKFVFYGPAVNKNKKIIKLHFTRFPAFFFNAKLDVSAPLMFVCSYFRPPPSA